jgi:hypothetical protein
MQFVKFRFVGHVRRARALSISRSRPGGRGRPGHLSACSGDAREAVKALLVTVDFLEAQVDELRAAVSTGYARRRNDVQPVLCTENSNPDVMVMKPAEYRV